MEDVFNEEINLGVFTENDINVGLKYFVVLANLARTQPETVIFYEEMVRLAKEHFPKDAEVARAVPIGAGKKLDFVKAFCNTRRYANLSCLVVSKKDKRPGRSYQEDWERQKREVAAFDWHKVYPQIESFAVEVRAASIAARAKPRPRMDEVEAGDLLIKHWMSNKSRYPYQPSQEQKKSITELIRDHVEVEDAFAQVILNG